MFKNLAFLFLFSASVQAMPKESQGFEKKEEWAGEIEEKIEKVSHSRTKNQLQEALQTILKVPQASSKK
jgi:23S rRNA A1618 N6-methylase RlmF